MRDLSTIETVVVHHSASGPNTTVEEIDGWHHDRGFRRSPDALRAARPHLLSIGYHRVIDPHGVVHLGRELSEIGAHCAGSNKRSVGICLIGNGRFTRDQILALGLQLDLLFGLLPSLRRVVGHRDLSDGTVCPGFDVATWLMLRSIGAPL